MPASIAATPCAALIGGVRDSGFKFIHGSVVNTLHTYTREVWGGKTWWGAPARAPPKPKSPRARPTRGPRARVSAASRKPRRRGHRSGRWIGRRSWLHLVFRVRGWGVRVEGSGLGLRRPYNLGFRVSGFGFRAPDFGFRISGFGFRVYIQVSGTYRQ